MKHIALALILFCTHGTLLPMQQSSENPPSNVKPRSVESPIMTHTFADHIISQAPEKIQLIVQRLCDQQYKGPAQNPLLLIGKPGTGKTTLAQAIAYKTNRIERIIHGPSIGNELQNSGQQHLLKFFNEVQKLKDPSVIIVDEITSFTRSYEEKHAQDKNKEVTEMFWILLDECLKNRLILIIATTNYPDQIPAQLASRFAKPYITVTLPSYQLKTASIRFFLGNQHACSDHEIGIIASCAHKMSNRDLKNLVDEAQRNAADDHNANVSFEHFKKACREQQIYITWPWRLLPTFSFTKDHKENLKNALTICMQVLPLLLQIYSIYQSYKQARIARMDSKRQHVQNIALQHASQQKQIELHNAQIAQQQLFHAEQAALQIKFHEAGILQQKEGMALQHTLHQEGIAQQTFMQKQNSEMQLQLHQEGMNFQKEQALLQKQMHNENKAINESNKESWGQAFTRYGNTVISGASTIISGISVGLQIFAAAKKQ